MHEAFLNSLFVELKYLAFVPGQPLVRFSDPPDRLLIIAQGKVEVCETLHEAASDIYVCMYIYTHIYKYMYAYIYIHMCVCVCVCMCIYICPVR